MVKESSLLTRACERYLSYDISSLEEKTGLFRSHEHFGSSHTVVTYFPLNTLGRLMPFEFMAFLGRDFYEFTSKPKIRSEIESANEIDLYIDIPFCRSKCGYCSYISEPNPEQSRVSKYFGALVKEIKAYAKLLQNTKINSIYIGGGTPTILSINQLSQLFNLLATDLNSDQATVCCEANPTTLLDSEGPAKLELLVENINRLSLGIQSFNDNILRSIGRGNYSGEKAIHLIRKIQETERYILNIDLMQDLPNQTYKNIEQDLAIVGELKPDSLTWYTMRIAQDCWLSNLAQTPSTEQSLISRIMIAEQLEALGYQNTSGDRFSLHKSARDTFKDTRGNIRKNMLGIGVSAYSHVDDFIFQNEKDIDAYINKVTKGKLSMKKGCIYRPEEKVVSEFVLGLEQGIDMRQLKDRHGEHFVQRVFNWANYNRLLALYEQEGLITVDNEITLTSKGKLFRNEISYALYSPVIRQRTRKRSLRTVLSKVDSDITFKRLGPGLASA